MSNKYFTTIKHHANVQTAGHLVMFAFAAASLANVEAFFAHLHPGLPALSWGLGIALGLGLVVMAGLLSGMTWAWKDPQFCVVAAVTAGLAVLSGCIQGAAYAGHMQNIIAAYVLGLALPVVGELGVALAVSAYTQSQRRQRMTDAQSQLADGIRAQIGDAVATIDPAKIKAQVERAANVITRAVVDHTVADMLAALDTGNTQNVTLMDTQGTPITDHEPTTPPIVNTNPADFTERMTQGKRNKTTHRQTELLRILQAEFNGAPADALNKTELAERLGATRQTIGRDIEELQAAQRLTVNGMVTVH